MNKPFFLPDSPLNNQGWRYLLTVILAFSGMIGFGVIPFQIAAQSKGLSLDKVAGMSSKELEVYFSNNELLSYQLSMFGIGFLLLLAAFKFNHLRPPIVFFTNRKRLDFYRWGMGFLIAFAIQAIIFAVELLIGNSSLKWNFKPEQFLLLLSICVFIMPIQTGFEELMCRSVLLKWTGKTGLKGWAVILVNGMVFALMHNFNSEVTQLGWMAYAYYASAGLFAALITVMDDGIELSWGFHTANNFMGLAIVSTDWQSLQTDSLWIDHSQPNIFISLLVSVLLVYPLMIFCFARLFRWTEWKQRLGIGRFKR